MTGLWFAVIALGGIAGLAAGIWLIVLAFRESVGWGVACLLIPFAGLVFAVKYWEDAKVPFVISLASIGLFMVGTLGYSVSEVNAGLNDFSQFEDSSAWDPVPEPSPYDAYPASDEEPVEAEVDAAVEEPVVEPAEPAQYAPEDVETVEARPEPTPAPPINDPPPEGRVRRREVVVPKENLGAMLGERVELVLHSGQKISARVDSVTPGSVVMRHRVGGGSVTYSVPLADISEVRVRRKQ